MLLVPGSVTQTFLLVFLGGGSHIDSSERDIMTRNIVVTGTGPGIGAMYAQPIADRGDTAIGLDLKNAEYEVDLSEQEASEAVGPGVVAAPMTTELLSSQEGRDMAFGAMPAPYNGAQRPEDIADVPGLPGLRSQPLVSTWLPW